MPKVMTESEYVKAYGNKCPVCGSKDLRGYDDMYDGATVFAKVGCLDCDAAWTEQYDLVGYGTLYLKGEEEPIEPDA